MGNLIYKLNKDGFLLANFHALQFNDSKFYVFLNYVQQVFYFEDDM